MRRLFWLIGAGVLAFAFVQWRAQGRPVWTKIASGVEMRTFHISTGGSVRILAFRTMTSRVHVATGEQLSAASWRRREGAILAVNGGFFDADGHSLGVRVSNGQRVSRVHGTRWGVFYVSHNKAHIVPTTEFKMSPEVQEAVQCGPRLVTDGKITSLKPQWARRTGLGIQRDGRVIVAIADGELSFQEWAAFWSATDGLNCRDALNLDGGSSTQLSLKTSTQSLEIPSSRLVPDAIVVR